jgi:hypothetical protein
MLKNPQVRHNIMRIIFANISQFLMTIFIVLPTISFAQRNDSHISKLTLIQADATQSISQGDTNNFIPCYGNIIFKHGNIVFKCDSAYFSNKKNLLIGIGNIHIFRNDSLLFSPSYFTYFADDKTIIINKQLINLTK